MRIYERLYTNRLSGPVAHLHPPWIDHRCIRRHGAENVASRCVRPPAGAVVEEAPAPSASCGGGADGGVGGYDGDRRMNLAH